MSSLSKSPGLRFFREVCRLVPVLSKQFEITELTSNHTLRRLVASRFAQHRDVANPKTTEMLIYKGRQELEEAVQRFVTRGYILDKWVTVPDMKARALMSAKPSGNSAFLDEFLESNYKKPTVC